jgi:FkbM family methyltransferase
MLVRLLDRPGGRFLLGRVATWYARRISGEDLEIAFLDGLWTHSARSYFFPDGRKFKYTRSDFGTWKDQAREYLFQAQDYWLRHYAPCRGDIIIDVGAGHGEDVLAFAKAVGPEGRVIAIEADSCSFAILKAFCKLNRLRNVTPVHLALMDQPGSVRIVESATSWMANSVDRTGAGPGDTVQAGTLYQLCSNEGIETIAFLKMNIEGAERHALSGVEPMIARIRQICVACHDFRSELGHGEQYRTRAFVESFLTKHGFTLASRQNDPRDYVRDHVFGLRPA